ncbi:MAG: InlB B-repeat-containing protein [Acholeplasmatales bacterium]|nr:InlB B-repeat-containing protein [Acholeplasmatales bacterium]
MKKILKICSLGGIILSLGLIATGCKKKKSSTIDKTTVKNQTTDNNTTKSTNSQKTTTKKDDTYTIKFVNEDDSVLSTQTLKKGEMPSYSATPTYSDEVFTYEFKGWDSEIVAANGDKTYKATYNKTYIDYTVTFLNNTEEVSTRTYHYGETIVYPDAPTREADKLCTYEFLQWDYNPTTCTENVVIYACFESHYINYTVTFIDHTGSVISTKTDYHYNDVITKPDNPTKDYCAFLGWALSSTGSVVNVDERVEGNKTYYAIFDKAKYRYRFVNYDGIIVSETTDYVGSQIVPPTNNPTRESTVSTVYTFDGWYTNMTGGIKVTEFGTLTRVEYYYARYTEETRKYIITWKMDNGDVIGTDLVEYGKTPACSYGTPTKTPDAQYSYVFTGWTPAISSVTGDYSYKAIFDKAIRSYTITWKNGNTTIYSEDYAYGKTPTYSGSTPTKSEDAQYVYTFSGWSPTISTVVGDQTYTAQYSTTTKTYTYYFYDEECVSAVTYTGAYGTQATKPATPTKAADADYTYTFDGWYELTTHVKVTDFTITGNKYLYPKFTSTNREYTITFKITSSQPYTTITQKWGTLVAAPANPTRDGYTFAGWNKTVPTTMPKENMTITATWTEVTYKWTLTKTCGSEVVYSDYTSGNLAYNASRTLKITKKPQTYTIVWVMDGVESQGDSFTFRMPAKATTITLKAIPYIQEYSNKIQMGMYPQSKVSGSIVDELRSMSHIVNGNVQTSYWTSYGFKTVGTNAQNVRMWYIDLDYDNDGYYDYRGVYFQDYLPKSVYATELSSGNSDQYDNGYNIGYVYYFKYEPIIWNVSLKDENLQYLYSDVILDAHVYEPSNSTSPYSHNGANIAGTAYQYSELNKWINNTFDTTAFTTAQLNILAKITTGSGSYSDEVIAASSTSYTNSNTVSPASARAAKVTEYAKCMGAYANYKDYGEYWTSSPVSGSGNKVYYIDENGTAKGDAYSYIYFQNIGIRPFIAIDSTKL